LSSTPYLEPGERFEGKIRQAHLISLAHYGKGDLAKAREAVKALEKYEADTRAERSAAADTAEKEALKADKKAEETNRAMADAMLPFTKKLEQIPPLREELRIWDALAENRLDEAKSLRDKLKKVPEERLLKIDWLLGKKDEVVKRAKEFATNNKDSVYSQAVLAEVLFKAEKMDEAKKAFADLRRICAHSDTDLPILVRLRPLADACGAQGDWREKPVAATDIGPRPPQSDFGPLLWGPTMAPQWQVEHPEKGAISHSSMAGQPHIVIFFLGKGCAHCIQQLHAFEPKHAQFAAAGLPILTMSTDTLDGVRDTVKLAKENGGFPFPIHADPTMGAFKAFNCFDDFENKPLHGTFLIDAQGRIRWQHISYEPFMEADFLLKEAQRLLRLGSGEAGVARK
jgi:peroxiredoxin